tara:strand:- start:2962 stop:3486 length:525 start_codon:yes stop_codon:yes gene_type:complete
MAFWSDRALEPKRSYRWILRLGAVPEWIIKKVDKPSFTVSESPHKFLNYTFYYPGKVEWNTLSVTLVDPITPDASFTMMQILEASGYKLPTNPNELETISKEKSTTALGNVRIEQIGTAGEVIEAWELRNAWITQVNFGNLDYDSEELVNIELTLRYDYAEMTNHGIPVEVDGA